MLRRLRSTEGCCVAVLCTMLNGCWASHGREDAEDGGHREDAAVGVECEGQFLVYEYDFDGITGDTGCIPAGSFTHTRRDSIRPGAPAWETSMGYRHEAAVHVDRTGLPMPQILCGGGMRFWNIDLISGESGTLEGSDPPLATGWEPRAFVTMVYDTTPGDGELCDGGAVGELASGTWHIIRGGSRPGDLIEVEARDVVFEPFMGHTLRFPRMRWRVRLTEPINYP